MRLEGVRRNRSGGLARAVVLPLQSFLQTEAAGGAVLFGAAVVALAWANSPWSDSYTTLWHTSVGFHVGSLHVEESLQHWVNDLAMSLFFFVVGLEIKREIVHGELRDPRTAALPITCAVGGMIAPALIFLAFNHAHPATRGGWGVPMATDIAFSVGVLALVGKRVPLSLRVFLLTLAIVDDIGAIVVIAVFYGDGFSPGWFLAALGALAAVVVLRRAGVRSLVPYIAVAAVAWLTMFESGVHATIAGVALGLLTPAHPLSAPEDVRRSLQDRLASHELTDSAIDEGDERAYLAAAASAIEGVSPLARLESALHPWSAFLVLPLFALANAGVSFDAGVQLGSPLTRGIVFGLVVGKPLGVLLAAVVAVKVFGARLPASAGWLELAGVGLLAGIGFTVSLFVSGLAFPEALADQAKIAVLLASSIAALLGAAALLARPAPPDDAAFGDPVDPGGAA